MHGEHENRADQKEQDVGPALQAFHGFLNIRHAQTPSPCA